MNVVVLLIVLGLLVLAALVVAGFWGTPPERPRSHRPKLPWLGEGFDRRQVMLDFLLGYPLRAALAAAFVVLALTTFASDCV